MQLSEAQLAELERIRKWACCLEPERRFMAEAENAALEEGLRLFRLDLDVVVNDGEPHEMGGPFIDGNWVLNRVDALLTTEKQGGDLDDVSNS